MKEHVLENILTRRSIRRYQRRPVPREILEQIIEAGSYAPSARNSQPWHFTVVTDPERIARVTAELKAAVLRMPQNPYKDFVGAASYSVNFHNAPVFIIVSGNTEASGMVESDCALALGTMFLAAHALGIGSCWVNQLGSACAEPGFRAFLTELGVPPHNYVYGSGAFGFAEGEPPAAPPRREGVISYISADAQ
ncbi:MAG: nitroreductase [Desulfovibrio sp.]|jgi:nitroreductase|nr:nitroreductase [Desulfovibrio sp.]